MIVGEECPASREPHIYVLNCVFNKQIPGELARQHNSAACRRQTTPSRGSAGSPGFCGNSGSKRLPASENARGLALPRQQKNTVTPAPAPGGESLIFKSVRKNQSEPAVRVRGSRLAHFCLRRPIGLEGAFGPSRKRANRKPVAVAGSLNWNLGGSPRRLPREPDSLRGRLSLPASKVSVLRGSWRRRRV